MSQPKLIKQDQDFRFNKVINIKVHPISGADRLSLGLTLGNDDVGLQVFDIDQSTVYFWDGSSWVHGTVDLDNLVFDEIPLGLINGVNIVFVTLNNFIPGQLDVFLNGLRQTIVVDYTTVGTNTILLNISPNSGELVTVNYIKQ